MKPKKYPCSCGNQPASLALSLFLGATTAFADSQTVPFNIPAQPLGSALTRFSTATGLQVLYEGDIAGSVQAPAVNGNYTPEAALRQLTRNTGLSYRYSDAGTVTLVKNAAEDQPVETPQVSGEGQVMPKVTVEADAENPYTDPNWTNDPYNKDYNRPNATTVTKTDTPLMQTPFSAKVVPSQVLKDQQVITVDQALRNVSGAVAGAGGTGTFFLRGFGNFNTYRDGFLNQSQWSHTVDLENIERVEVLKGPGSILYGRTEPGGLVNFVTKNPLDTPYYSFRQQFGSFDHYRTSIDATGPITANKDLGYRFNLGYQTNRTFQEFGGNERLLVAPTLRWKISDQTTSTLKVEYSDIQEKGNGTVPLLGNRPAPIPRSLNLGDPWNIQEDEYVMLSLNTEHAFNDNWKLRHRFDYKNHTSTFAANSGISLDPTTGDVRRFFFAQNIDGNDYQHFFFNALEMVRDAYPTLLRYTPYK